ncbi:MAG TPA: Ppx/GppA family phosphatase [Deltaproteobacteria bacterium]|nr:Ppx/GppA family phosphatase [Deltaproteobacteria bacterium]
MRIASIDIGSNTLRLLVAETTQGGALKEIARSRRITRLGGGFTEETGLKEDAIERTIEALKEFKEIADRNGAECILTVATSVVRRAKNRELFLERVKEEIAIDVKVIDGTEEARLSVEGVLSVIETDKEDTLVVDIGGGSTEFVYCRGSKILKAKSVENMGVVHLTEGFIKEDPPAREELERLEKRVDEFVRMVKEAIRDVFRAGECELCGTAGTVTTLASIDQSLDTYEPELINNYILTYDNVKAIYQRLSLLTLEERKSILSLEKGREDLIIPGAAIVLACMEGFGIYTMRVSDAGLLEGIIIDALKKESYRKGGVG